MNWHVTNSFNDIVEAGYKKKCMVSAKTWSKTQLEEG